MEQTQITDIRVRSGKLQARLAGTVPEALVLLLDGVNVGMADISGSGGEHVVQAKLPMDALSDSARVLTISDPADETVLASIPISIGEAHANDLRADVELLRAELDLVKRAVRRISQDKSRDDDG